MTGDDRNKLHNQGYTDLMCACYRTPLASDVVAAKDQNQKGMVAVMEQLAARSSSGQVDPTLHLAHMIFSWTGW